MKTMFIILFLLGWATSWAQGDETPNVKKNALYFELLGNGLIYSGNYERVIGKGTFPKALRVGITYANFSLWHENKAFGIPIELLGWTGKKNGHLEFGVGYTYYDSYTKRIYLLGPSEESESTSSMITGRLGYRYQKPKGGFVFRAAFVPMLIIAQTTTKPDPADIPAIGPYFGLSFGKAF